MRQRREYDEEDVRVRPGRSSRPRTRRRPGHTDAVEAMVTAVHLGRFRCLRDDGTTLTAMRARELGRRSVVVGDTVALVGDVSGDPDQLARIVRVQPRRSVLRRTADDDQAKVERVVVANADQLVIVSALADPPPRTGFIDRCLVAAYDAGIEPLLCLTKADLVAPRQGGPDDPLTAINDYYAALSLRWLCTRPDQSLDPLRAALRERISVLVGHSGVGKSTLVNKLVPGADRAVGEVSAVGKGRHVSSSAVALPLPGGDGWIIDTPGVRSFGLAHVSADKLLASFGDLVGGSADCPRGCDHNDGECALDDWVAQGHADPGRLASYRRLLASRGGEV